VYSFERYDTQTSVRSSGVVGISSIDAQVKIQKAHTKKTFKH